MELEEKITRKIIEYASRDWLEHTNVDVVVVGAGPAGLTASKYLSDRGFKTLVLERRLSFGGGIGGGGMLFHRLVVEERVKPILEDFGIRYVEAGGDLLVVDSAELMAKLAAGAIDSGARIIHGITVDDVVYRDNPHRITGVAIQWTPVIMSGLHVDPLFIYSRAVVDATGHDAEVLTVAARKIPELGFMPEGEKSAYAESAEELVVERTGKVVDGLYVAGMAVAALYGLPRMGPVFGGMLLSGKRVADVISEELGMND